MRLSCSDFMQAIGAAEFAPEDDWRANGLSSLQEMPVVIDALVRVLTELGYPAKDIFGARLSLEEAICNAIKVVEVRYCIRVDHFLLEVEDQGPGFDPARVPDATAPENLARPCGRGLLLMRHYAAWVRHNRTGNCVTLCFYASEPLPQELAGN